MSGRQHFCVRGPHVDLEFPLSLGIPAEASENSWAKSKWTVQTLVLDPPTIGTLKGEETL